MSNMPDKVYLITPSYNKNIRKGYEGVLKTWAKTINKEIPVQIISLSESSKNIDNIIIQSSSVNVFQIIFNFIYALINNIPFQSNLFFSKKIFNKIRKLDEIEENSVFIFFTIRCHYLSLAVLKNRKIIHAVDSMLLNFKGKFESEKNIFKKSLYFIEFRRLKYKETLFLKTYERNIFVSSRDINFLELKNACEIPLVVKSHSIKDYKTSSSKFIIGMSGNFNYSPNINAAYFLIRSILPLLHEDIELRLIGFNADRFISEAFQLKNLKIKNNVPSIPEHVKLLDVSIAPMLDGSGMQNKIIDAMSLGVPVITNKFGLGSIQAIPDKSIIIYDDQESLISSIKRLSKDEALLRSIGEEGYKLIQSKYTSKSVSSSIMTVLKND
jgi:glycosyltransferase involved in cell wall biosynthesis